MFDRELQVLYMSRQCGIGCEVRGEEMRKRRNTRDRNAETRNSDWGEDLAVGVSRGEEACESVTIAGITNCT